MARQTRAAKEQRCFTMLRSLDLPTDMNDEAEACHQECVRILKDTPLESRDEAMIEFFSRIVRKARTHEALVEHFVSVCSEYDFNVEENCKLETEADQELLAKATKNHKEILSLRKQLANDHCFSIEGTSLADAKRSTLKKAKELFDLGRILHKPQATVQEAILTAVRDRPCQPRRGLVEIQKSWEGEKTAFSKQPQAGGQEDALSCTAPSWASTADEFSSIDHTTHPPINGTTTEGRGGGSVKRQGPESAVSNTSKRFKGDHAKRDPETTTINNGQDNNSAVGAMGNSQADSSPSIEKGRGYASSNGPNLSEEDISFPALNEFEEGVSDTSFEISCNTPGITAKARVCMPDLAPTGRRGPSEPTDSTVKICKHTSDIIDVDSARLGLSDDINDPDIDMLVSGLGLQHDEVALASSYCRSALSSLQPEARLTDAAINLLIGSEVYGRFKIEVLDQIEMKSQIESPSPSRRVSVDLKGAHHLLLPYCCMDHWILVCMESDRENAGRYTLSFYDSLKDRNQDLAKSGSKLLKDYLILMNAIPKDVKLQPQQKDYKSVSLAPVP